MALPVAPGKVAMRKTFRIMASYRWRFAGVLTVQVIAVLATLVAPQLLGRLVTRVASGTGTAGYVDRIVLLIAAVTIVGAVINRFAQKHARTLGESVFADLRERMMHRVVHLPLSAVESAGTGDLVGRTTNDVSRIEFLVRVGIPQIMVCTVTIVFTIVAAAVSDPLLAAGLLVVVPPVWAMMSWYLPISVPAYRARSAASARLNGAVSETVENAETVDALGIGAHREAVIAASVKEAWSLERYTAGLRLRLLLVLDIAWRAPVVVILLWGAFLAAGGHAGLGAITTVALYAMELRKPIAQLMFWIDLVQVSQASLSRILGVEEVPEDRSPTGAAPDGHRMVLRDVRFSYREGAEVLHGIDLDLVPGERLAVVGPSGSGKSTLLNLIGTLDRPSSGRVEIDGLDVAGLTDPELSAVRARRIGFVFQQFHLSDGMTAIDNVADGLLYLGVPRAERRRRAEAALRRVGLERRLRHRPHQLSGGERQRVAIARAVVGDPPLLLADEPTGNLDSVSGASIVELLHELHEQGTTVVVITHDNDLAAELPRRVAIRDGKLVSDSAIGTTEEAA